MKHLWKITSVLAFAAIIFLGIYGYTQSDAQVQTGLTQDTSDQVSPEKQRMESTQNTPPDPAFRQSFETAKASGLFKYGIDLACFPTSRFDCSEDGCVQNQPNTYYFIDHGTEGGSYFRCDSAGCDQYDIDVHVSGVFTQFAPKNASAAMLFKVSSLDNSFVDVATIGTNALVSYGKCE